MKQITVVLGASLIIAGAIFFTGCQKDNTVKVCEERISNNSAIIPVEEALCKLDLFLAELENGGTKSVTSRVYDKSKVQSITLDKKTKSNRYANLPDTLVYIVEFENNQGCAVLPANRQVGESVICVTDSGVLIPDFSAATVSSPRTDLSQDVDNLPIRDAGESFAADLLGRAILASAGGNHHPGDDRDQPIDLGDDGDGRDIGLRFVYECLTPEFGQQEPWNIMLDWVNIGCSATAICEVMAYNRYPSPPAFANMFCDWNSIINKDANQSAAFAYDIAHWSGIVPDDYGRGGGNVYGRRQALIHYGYQNVELYRSILSLSSILRNKIINSVKNNKPIPVGATHWATDSELAGHAFVIDGYTIKGYLGSNEEHVHVNWGWEGEYNGYFSMDVFNPVQAYSYDDQDSFEYNEDKNKEFDFNFNIVEYNI